MTNKMTSFLLNDVSDLYYPILELPGQIYPWKTVHIRHVIDLDYLCGIDHSLCGVVTQLLEIDATRGDLYLVTGEMAGHNNYARALTDLMIDAFQKIDTEEEYFGHYPCALETAKSYLVASGQGDYLTLIRQAVYSDQSQYGFDDPEIFEGII